MKIGYVYNVKENKLLKSTLSYYLTEVVCHFPMKCLLPERTNVR